MIAAFFAGLALGVFAVLTLGYVWYYYLPMDRSRDAQQLAKRRMKKV